MGEEIQNDSRADAQQFASAALAETELLCQWIDSGSLAEDDSHFGLELEGCLVDENALPALRNEEFLVKANEDALCAELAQFNFEYNSPVYKKDSDFLANMQADLETSAKKIQNTASLLSLEALWIGILPTIRDDMLSLETMTPLNRYFELSKRLMDLRGSDPVRLKIDRFDSVELERENFMTEAAATSLQVHTQVKPSSAVRAYNAALLVSAPCTAIAANSPFLYGRKLWDETRIPVFEQSLAIPATSTEEDAPVTFGKGYLQNSVKELFQENINSHKAILPALFDDPVEKLRHLKFLNGQIWRWVRPIVGVDYGGIPHFRLEQRSMPAGPTIVDTVANIAFYIGLLQFYINRETALESVVSFKNCRQNFYDCARLGMKAEVAWGGKRLNIQSLIHNQLLEEAKQGLQSLNVPKNSITFYIDEVMKYRARTGFTGAAWQKSFIDLHGPDFQKLTHTYIERQRSGQPVHEWKV